jgi:MFS family permease
MISKKKSHKNILSECAPLLLVIFLYELFAIKIHTNINISKNIYVFWLIAQIIGSISFAYISDKHCRKKTLIVTQIFAIVFLSIFILSGYSAFILILLGLTFNPVPLARAAMIDNFALFSKVKLIAFTLIASYLPWVFYGFLTKIFQEKLMVIIIIFLSVNLLITFLFFDDRRDKSHDCNILHIIKWKKISYILIAFFPVQLSFFISAFFLENNIDELNLFSSLAIGIILGAVISTFYKKIPHVSFLTLFYGIGFCLSFTPIFSIWFFPAGHINIAYQLMVFSTLSGFYIPFLYDVILSAAHSDYRGVACGFIHVFYSAASLSALFLIKTQNPSAIAVLVFSTILFFIAFCIQKFAEHKFEQN